MAFQGERLIFARKKRQVSQKDLASIADVTPRSLQRYERDEESPKADTLARLAKALTFPPEFFTDARPLADIPPLSISFRGYSKIKAKLRDNAVTVAQLAAGIEAALARDFDLPELEVPDLSEATAEPVQAARVLREEWSLGSGPIPNMVHLLERHGVRVFSADAAADVDAFCFWNAGRAFAVLSRAKSPERGRFDCAHELAHLTLHRTIDFRRKDLELEADAFAGEFLVPSAALAAHAPSYITPEPANQIFPALYFDSAGISCCIPRNMAVGVLNLISIRLSIRTSTRHSDRKHSTWTETPPRSTLFHPN